MKLLLDQGLPRSAAKLLNAAGIEAVHVGEIGYATASDFAILEKAREDGCIVVALDAGFHSLMALSGAVLPSIIRICIEGLQGKALVNLLQYVLRQCVDDLDGGALVTVQTGRIRTRRLPLISTEPNT